MQTIIVYRPYGTTNLNAPYIVASTLGYLLTYLKRFLKPFYPIIVIYNNRYPQYQRRDNLQLWPIYILGGNSATINLNNRYIVLYNLYLSVKYRAYINIKAYASIQAIKYINKYIYKGDDCITIQLLDNNDKISKYLYSRHISPIEAVQRLFKFPIYKEYPPIIYLTIYLPSQQPIYFQLDKSIEDLQQRLKIAYLTLTAQFQYNTKNIDSYTTLYQDFPYKYTFIVKIRQQQRRAYIKDTVIGRIYYYSPITSKRYYLRLLLTVIPSATSFKYLRTIAGTIYLTF